MRYRVTTAIEAAEAVTELVSGARRSIDILSPALDPVLYDQATVTAAVRDLVTNAGRRARVRLLIRDGGEVVGVGHGLVRLSQQLTTAIAIRRLAAEDADDEDACVIVDERAVLRWDVGSGYMAWVEPHARGEARRVTRAFLARWERGQPAPELRHLVL